MPNGKPCNLPYRSYGLIYDIILNESPFVTLKKIFALPCPLPYGFFFPLFSFLSFCSISSFRFLPSYSSSFSYPAHFYLFFSKLCRFLCLPLGLSPSPLPSKYFAVTKKHCSTSCRNQEFIFSVASFR